MEPRIEEWSGGASIFIGSPTLSPCLFVRLSICLLLFLLSDIPLPPCAKPRTAPQHHVVQQICASACVFRCFPGFTYFSLPTVRAAEAGIITSAATAVTPFAAAIAIAEFLLQLNCLVPSRLSLARSVD